MKTNNRIAGLLVLIMATLPIIPAVDAQSIEVREYAVFEDDGNGEGSTSFQFNATPYPLSGSIDTTNSTTYMIFWAMGMCRPSSFTNCNLSFSVTFDNGGGPVVVPSTSPQLVKVAGSNDELGAWYEVWNLGNSTSTYFRDTSWINVSVTDLNGNALRERFGVQVWQREIVSIADPVATLASEIEVVSVFDEWLPFLVFAAAAIWGWTGRNLLLAVIGTVGMLGVFVLPLWGTPVVILFGVLAIWADFFAHYGKRSDQAIEPGAPGVGGGRE